MLQEAIHVIGNTVNVQTILSLMHKIQFFQKMFKNCSHDLIVLTLIKISVPFALTVSTIVMSLVYLLCRIVCTLSIHFAFKNDFYVLMNLTFECIINSFYISI